MSDNGNDALPDSEESVGDEQQHSDDDDEYHPEVGDEDSSSDFSETN